MSTISRLTALEQRMSLLEEALLEHGAFLRSLNTMIDTELAAHHRSCDERLAEIKQVLVAQIVKMTATRELRGARA